MSSKYDIESTSRDSAIVRDIVISNPENEATATTRRVLRAQLVNNVHSSTARVRAMILHQRRHKRSQPWEDTKAFNLATLKAGEEVRLELSAGQTWRLLQALQDLHAISKDGIPQGQKRFVEVSDEGVVVDIQAREIIEYLSKYNDTEFRAALEELTPDLLTAVALKRQHEDRHQAVQEFEQHLQAGDWTEQNWQTFFETHTWIFGHGLAYQFLNTVIGQPGYGGVTVQGNGAQRGDFLMSTAAEMQFTVLVDIKKPQSELLTSRPYRNKVYGLSVDLIGGVAQLQSNCRTWMIEGARTDENRALLEEQRIYTYEPKGILIIGNTYQLDNVNKRATFELFRRNLHNPEVLTFDELLARARFLVKQSQA